MACSAHRLDHVRRVYKLCVRLAGSEPVDRDVLRAAALLHDVARAREDGDPSGNTDHAALGADMARDILQRVDFPQDKIESVCACIRTHRFRTGQAPESLEAQMLFDADKLDTIGAVGVARSFMWVGLHGARMHGAHNVDAYIKENLGGEAHGRIRDKSKHTSQIEYETKIKFLPKRMHTEKARHMAEERAAYYKAFLDRLDQEVRGIQ